MIISIKDHTGTLDTFRLQPEDSIRRLKQLLQICKGNIPFEEIGIRFAEKQVLSNQLMKEFPTSPTFEMFVISIEIQRLKTENEALRKQQQISVLVMADLNTKTLQLNDLKSRHDQFIEQQKLYQSKIDEQQEQLGTYDIAYKQAQATNQVQYNLLEQANFSIQQYEEYVQAQNNAIYQLQDDLDAAQEKITLLTKSEEDLQELKQQVTKNSEIENKVCELETQVTKQKSVINGLDNKIVKQKGKIKALYVELELMNSSKRMLEEELREIKQETKPQQIQFERQQEQTNYDQQQRLRIKPDIHLERQRDQLQDRQNTKQFNVINDSKTKSSDEEKFFNEIQNVLELGSDCFAKFLSQNEDYSERSRF